MSFPRLLAAVLGATGLCCSAATYRLEHVAEDTFIRPALNRHGAVAGQTQVADFMYWAHIYENGNKRFLKAVGDANNGRAINDRGDVAGQCQPNGNVRACIWRNDGSVRTFRGPEGYREAVVAADMNNARQVVGFAAGPNGSYRPFLFDNGVTKDLGTLGGTRSYGTGINKTGQVSGYSTTANGSYHAFIHDGTQLKDLGTLVDDSYAEDLNDNGVAVGWADVSGSEHHAVMFKDGQVIDLIPSGGQSRAWAINNHDVVVGEWGSSGSGVAIIYRQGRMTDLNTELDPVSGQGWKLQSAVDINDRGQIVALASRMTGDHQIVLLTPMD